MMFNTPFELSQFSSSYVELSSEGMILIKSNNFKKTKEVRNYILPHFLENSPFLKNNLVANIYSTNLNNIPSLDGFLNNINKPNLEVYVLNFIGEINKEIDNSLTLRNPLVESLLPNRLTRVLEEMNLKKGLFYVRSVNTLEDFKYSIAA